MKLICLQFGATQNKNKGINTQDTKRKDSTPAHNDEQKAGDTEVLRGYV